MQNQIQKAVEVLKAGGIILLPTETVYGIAVDASNNSAMEKIYKLKAREALKPLQIMVKDIERAKKLAVFNDGAEKLAKKFWPGALTIILKYKKDAGLAKFNKVDDTIGLRIPDHKVALEILEAFGKPLAVSSANISGQEPAIEHDKAAYSLNGIDLLIDGGISKVGVSSTVVSLVDGIKILREGSISEDYIMLILDN